MKAFLFDSLIADAKRRMRWRRFLVVVAVAAVIGMAVGLTLGLRSSSSSRGASSSSSREAGALEKRVREEVHVVLTREARLRLLANKARQRQLGAGK